jgi:hypothetical protein
VAKTLFLALLVLLNELKNKKTKKIVCLDCREKLKNKIVYFCERHVAARGIFLTDSLFA